MALLRDNAGDVQPRLKRTIQLPSILLAADVDLGSLVAGNFSIESGTDRDKARQIARDCALRDDGDKPGGAKPRDVSDADRARIRHKANNLDT